MELVKLYKSNDERYGFNMTNGGFHPIMTEEAIGESHNTWLTTEELKKMRKYYQQRHLLAHNNGIVDEEYLRKSKDDKYNVEQRIIIDKQDVIEFTNIIKKLGNEILKFAK